MDIFRIITDKDIDKLCDKIIKGNLTIVPARGGGKTYLSMRVMQRLIERGYCSTNSIQR